MNAQVRIKLQDEININFFVLHGGEVGHTNNIRKNCVYAKPQGYQEKAKQPRSEGGGGLLEEQDWSRAGLSEPGTGRWFGV